jgi:hypothetical protein
LVEVDEAFDFGSGGRVVVFGALLEAEGAEELADWGVVE